MNKSIQKKLSREEMRHIVGGDERSCFIDCTTSCLANCQNTDEWCASYCNPLCGNICANIPSV